MTVSEPEVRYCMTSDGVQIAYAVDGDGSGTPYLGLGAAPWSNVRRSYWEEHWERTVPISTGSRPMAWFDFRGCGLSDRRVDEISMEALERDLDAVIARLDWPVFSLVAAGMAGPIAIKYAAEHSERVTSLVLNQTFARAAEMGRIPRMRALGLLLQEDWDSYLTLMAVTMGGWYEGGERFVQLLAGCSTPEMIRAYAAATRTFDASMFVDKIQARTLVVGRDDTPVPTGDMLRQLAARIRDARVVMLRRGPEGERNQWLVIESFLAEGDAPPAASSASLPRGMAVVLFTDIVDSTALTERMGDAAFRTASRRIDDGVRAAIRESGGSPVKGKVLGDGVMGVFSSAAQAIEAARACVRLAAESGPPLHIGIHAGDVTREDDNVYGGAVNIASRICGLCEPGEILVSQTVRDLARTSAGVAFEDRGERELKGIADAVRVFAVRKDGA